MSPAASNNLAICLAIHRSLVEWLMNTKKGRPVEVLCFGAVFLLAERFLTMLVLLAILEQC